MDSAKLFEILGRITLFKELDDKERKLILTMPKAFEVFSAGEAIVREGEQEACFYVLLSGIANVYVNGQELTTLLPPQFVGEVGFICNEPRIATVVAKEQVMAMRIDSAAFAKLPATIRERVKDKIIAGLVSRVKEGNQSLTLLKSRPKFNAQINTGIPNFN